MGGASSACFRRHRSRARALFFLKGRYWIYSACDATAYLSLSGFKVLNAYHQFSSLWAGVDYLLNRGFYETDLSSFALLVGATLLVIGSLGYMRLTALAEKLARLMS